MCLRVITAGGRPIAPMLLRPSIELRTYSSQRRAQNLIKKSPVKRGCMLKKGCMEKEKAIAARQEARIKVISHDSLEGIGKIERLNYAS